MRDFIIIKGGTLSKAHSAIVSLKISCFEKYRILYKILNSSNSLFCLKESSAAAF